MAQGRLKHTAWVLTGNLWIGARAVRRGPWKLIVSDEGTPELYHLDKDIGESINLAPRLPERVQALSDAWIKWDTDVKYSARRYQP